MRFTAQVYALSFLLFSQVSSHSFLVAVPHVPPSASGQHPKKRRPANVALQGALFFSIINEGANCNFFPNVARLHHHNYDRVSNHALHRRDPVAHTRLVHGMVL